MKTLHKPSSKKMTAELCLGGLVGLVKNNGGFCVLLCVFSVVYPAKIDVLERLAVLSVVRPPINPTCSLLLRCFMNYLQG